MTRKKREQFLTSGQVAKSLRISVSTLKRWLQEVPTINKVKQNSNGWKLFTIRDVEKLKRYQKEKRKQGRTYKPSTLAPVE